MTDTPSFGLPAHIDDTVQLQPGSFLSEVHDDLAEEVRTPDVNIPVQTRPGYAAVYSSQLESALLRTWQVKLTHKGVLDEMKLATIVLQNQNVGIAKNGKRLTDTNGMDITFQSPEFLSLTNSPSVPAAIKKFYGQDGLISATAGTVLSQCGYDAEVGVDPTPDSIG